MAIVGIAIYKRTQRARLAQLSCGRILDLFDRVEATWSAAHLFAQVVATRLVSSQLGAKTRDRPDRLPYPIDQMLDLLVPDTFGSGFSY